MKLNDVQALNVQRAVRWHKSGIDEWSALEWAGAMAGEAGEACNAAKKLKRLDGGIASMNAADRHFTESASARAAVGREVADTIIYGLLLMARVGISDPESVIAEVFNRKSEEYGFPERL